MPEVRKFEVLLEKHTAQSRKRFSGRGAIGVSVRIVGDVLFVRTKHELTPLEKLHIEFIKQDPMREREYHSFIKEKVLDCFEFPSLHPLLEVKDISFILEEDGNIIIIRLTQDIEALIKSRKVKAPLKLE